MTVTIVTIVTASEKDTVKPSYVSLKHISVSTKAYLLIAQSISPYRLKHISVLTKAYLSICPYGSLYSHFHYLLPAVLDTLAREKKEKRFFFLFSPHLFVSL